MKKCKQISKWIAVFAFMCTVLLPCMTANIQAAEYEIVFKAGAHGTFHGEKAVSYRVENQDVFPNEPDIIVEAGYVFTGWNKTLPPVGSAVTGKEIYVAKYGVVVDGINYTVHYVDENKVDIATPKTMFGEKGTEYSVRAKNIPGYTYQTSDQTFVLDQNNKQIYMVYTLTNPALVERVETVYENEEITQPNQTTQPVNNANNQDEPNNEPENTPTEEERDIPEQDQPLSNGEEVDIPENDTPLAKGSSSNVIGIGAGVGACVIVAAAIFMILKRKKQK